MATMKSNKDPILKPRHLLDDEDEKLLAKKLFGNLDDDSDSDLDSEDDVESQGINEVQKKTAVWKDDDDDIAEEIEIPKKKMARNLLKRSTDESNAVEKKEYQKRLRKAFERTHNAGKVPSWAKIEKHDTKITGDSDDEVESALNEMTRTTGRYLEKDDLLPKGIFQSNILQDITVGHGVSRPLNILRFHKNKNVLLTAGDSGHVHLYQVDTEVKKEHFLQSVKFTKFPVTSMDFLSGGNSIICGSRTQEYFMRYDLNHGSVSQSKLPRSLPAQNVGLFAVSSDGSLLAFAGHSRQVHVLSASSMEHIKSQSFSSEVVSLTFTPQSTNELWVMSENGQVHIWNIRNSDVHHFMDDGAVKGTCISVSNNGEYIACGSNTGIVNVYNPSDVKLSSTPRPVGTCETLLTSSSHIAFNHDCQLMAASGDMKKSQIRMMHLRSKTMMSNFPSIQENIPNVSVVEFSPHSGYMALGCKNGNLRLYRIPHFDNY